MLLCNPLNRVADNNHITARGLRPGRFLCNLLIKKKLAETDFFY